MSKRTIGCWMLGTALGVAAAGYAQPSTQPTTRPAAPAAAVDEVSAAIQARLLPGGRLDGEILEYTRSARPEEVKVDERGLTIRPLTPPPATLRDGPLVFPEKPHRLERVRPTFETPIAGPAADPPRPGRPILPAGPRYATRSDTDVPWLPLPSVLRSRGESPSRPHDPILNVKGTTEMDPVAGAFRTAALAGLKVTIPDPYEHIRDAQVPGEVEETIAPAAVRGLPARVLLQVSSPSPSEAQAPQAEKG